MFKWPPCTVLNYLEPLEGASSLENLSTKPPQHNTANRGGTSAASEINNPVVPRHANVGCKEGRESLNPKP